MKKKTFALVFSANLLAKIVARAMLFRITFEAQSTVVHTENENLSVMQFTM